MARTPRMDQIEALLADEPDDAFLRYGLAMEYSSVGDDAHATELLLELIKLGHETKPYIPAYLQCGQALARLGKDSQAVQVLKEGIQKAGQAGDLHAKGEMEGLLSTLE